MMANAKSLILQELSSHYKMAPDSGDGFEFCRLAAFLGRARREKPIRLKNDAGPALPGGIDLLGLGQPKEMTFGCEDLSELRTKGRAEIPRLAGLFRDDQSRHGARRIE